MAYVVRNITKNFVLATEVQKAASLWSRMKGLLGRKSFQEGEGLWIERCRSIHTHFMRFSIDAIFVDGKGTVIRTFENLKPFRMTPYQRKADHVLEVPSGTLSKYPTGEGDQLSLEAQ